jgi:hypothetical protein
VKKPRGHKQELVWRNGKLCWRLRQVYHEPIRKPWYKFWKLADIEITYGEPKYIEVPEVIEK